MIAPKSAHVNLYFACTPESHLNPLILFPAGCVFRRSAPYESCQTIPARHADMYAHEYLFQRTRKNRKPLFKSLRFSHQRALEDSNPDLLVRSQTLYPAELNAHVFVLFSYFFVSLRTILIILQVLTFVNNFFQIFFIFFIFQKVCVF